MIPPPPDLQPTIIQMQNVDEVKFDISPTLNPQKTTTEQLKKRKRRSSSSIVSQSEIEKRRREHKAAHSIIEKKRRIRMNREFEALKYLIPACRSNLTSSNNNGEGMYKLTILQAAVDYIKYLHNVINIQNNLIQNNDPQNDNDLEFVEFNIDTDAYRDVEQDFDFNKLFEEVQKHQSISEKDKHQPLPISSNMFYYPTKNSPETAPISKSIRQPSDSTNDSFKLNALPSPIITPELYPRLSNSSINSTTQLSIPQTKEFQEPILKSDYQFPTVSQPSNQISQPRSPSTADITSKMNVINEMATLIDNNETSSVHALLSMKKDGDITSIKSLLN